MIYTSYYANYKKITDNMIPISISLMFPKGYNKLRYYKLAPTRNILKEYKQNGNKQIYLQKYVQTVLNNLKVEDVLSEIYHLLPTAVQDNMNNDPEIWFGAKKWYESANYHIVLLCYEKPEDFCHRHIVAKWFEHHHIHCTEL